MTERSEQLKQWCTTYLKHSIEWESVSGDASFRSFYRIVNTDPSYIAVNSPPKHENNEMYLHLSEYFLKNKIAVPQLLGKNVEEGFFLIEDFGRTLLYDALQTNGGKASKLRDQTIDLLIQWQKIDTETLPSYTPDMFIDECDLFKSWFLERYLQITFSNKEKKQWSTIIQKLIDSALAQPQVCTHRDFHSKNLMLRTNNTIGVIDFQDAVLGPITYDITSLLHDCYIPLQNEIIQKHLLSYYEKISQTRKDIGSWDSFQESYDLMTLQRHLKVVGIFSRLSLRDGKPNYLKHIPHLLKMIQYNAQKYSVTSWLSPWIEEIIVPKLEKAKTA